MTASFMSAPNPQPARHAFPPWQFGLFLGLLLLATFPQVISGLETFVARDYGFFAYPLALFQKECLWRGELPFWDPYNNCGVPFLAQWNTMPLYPPSLLYLVFPLAWSLSCFSLLHLWFGGLGMFFLARRWTGNGFAAAFAGTAFAFNGFALNLLMWPSHIATFAWMPWVVLAVEAAWREGGKKLLLAAFAGALQMLAGGPETICFTWLVVSALWLQQFLDPGNPRRHLLWRYPLIVALVFSLSAVQLLPFLDLVAHAQRETGYTDLRWSMPGFGLASFLLPMAFGSTAAEGIFFQDGQYWTSSYYLGIGTLWLALLACLGLQYRWQAIRSRQTTGAPIAETFAPWRKFCGERGLLLALLVLGSLLCALGDHTPFYPCLRWFLPQLSLITYPVKFVTLTVFAAPLLAAFALANLPSIQKKLLPVGSILLVLLGGIVIWTQHSHPIGAHAALLNGLSRAFFLLVTGACLFILARDVQTPVLRFTPLALILLAWLDVFTHEPRQNPTANPAIYRLNLARARLAMDPQPELGGSRAMLSPAAALALSRFAVSDPRNNLLAKRMGYCANVNLLDAVPKVDGFFSLRPREFDGLSSLIYGTTNFPWSAIESFIGVSQYTSDTNFLAWRPRTNFLPLVTAGQRPVFLDDSNLYPIFARSAFDPAKVVFLPPASQSLVAASDQTDAQILDLKFADSTVDFQVQTAEPSIAVVAQAYYHDWQAEVDGRPAPLLRANLAFQAVPVPAGTHRVHLYYQDRAFEIGAAISGCMWVNCLVSFLALRRRDLPAAPPRVEGDYF
jgi:hypothetical protein